MNIRAFIVSFLLSSAVGIAYYKGWKRGAEISIKSAIRISIEQVMYYLIEKHGYEKEEAFEMAWQILQQRREDLE